jgi:hypothetical protein
MMSVINCLRSRTSAGGAVIRKKGQVHEHGKRPGERPNPMTENAR